MEKETIMKWLTVVIFSLIVLLSFALRVYKVVSIPPGLYIDEVSIGVNAYDIMTTGKDEFGVPHPLTFAAYGEYKMPVYIYLVSFVMKFLGKTEFAIRLPSVILGSLTVGIFFLLVKEVLALELKKKRRILLLSIFGAICLMISPWHLQFSRAGFEATIALCFYTIALLSFVYFYKKKNILFFICAGMFLLLSFYSYDGYRLIVPLTFAGSWYLFWKANRQMTKMIVISIFLVFGLLPLLFFTLSSAGLIRLSQTSAFSSNHFQYFWQQILANCIVYIKNYFSFFSLTFLFRFGDQINRHQVQEFGLYYIWEFPYVAMGFLELILLKSKLLRRAILFLLFIAPAAAAFTVPSPHALRFLMAIIPITFLIILGMWYILQHLQKRKVVLTLILFLSLIIAIVQFVYYLDYYYIHYPKTALMDWGGSCKKLVKKVSDQQTKFKTIFIDTSLLCIHEYFSFYSPKVTVNYIAFNDLAKIKNNHSVLFVKPKNNNIPQGKLIDKVYLPNLNHDVFGELWKL